MIGRKAIVGLSLLCTLALCAFSAANAAAQDGVKLFTCVSDAKGAFGNDHCDKAGKTWGHLGFKDNTTFTVHNNETNKEEETETVPAVMSGTVAGVKLVVDAKEVAGSGTAENKEVSAESWEAVATGTYEYTGLTVTKPSGCTIKSPLVLKATLTSKLFGTEGLGLEFKPSEGSTFGQFTLEGAECILKGTTVKLGGSATSTPGGSPTGIGAIFLITPEMSSSTFTLAGGAAELTQPFTLKGQNGGALTATKQK